MKVMASDALSWTSGSLRFASDIVQNALQVSMVLARWH